MEQNQNIFVTSSEYKKISKNEIMSLIPSNALKFKNTNLSKTHKEFRWRIFKLPTKENQIIEISFKLPNDNRLFMNKHGKWVYRDIGNEHNNFLVEEYYVYESIN